MIILGVNPLFEGRNNVRSKNYERGENDMDSIFSEKTIRIILQIV